MRISELSEVSGVSVPTIKYYLRERLLQPGTSTGRNRAEYGEDHVHRLRLIRALTDLGNLPIATMRRVIGAIDDPTISMHDLVGVAHRALAPPPIDDASSTELEAARMEVERFLESRGWLVSEDAPGRTELARSLATLLELGWDVDSRVFDPYAEHADELASWELAQTPTHASPQRTVEAVVVGTVVFEKVLAALRRLAQENHSATHFSGARAASSPARAKSTPRS